MVAAKGRNVNIRIYGLDDKAGESLTQYIARPPLALNKIKYEEFRGQVSFKTKYNEYFGENLNLRQDSIHLL